MILIAGCKYTTSEGKILNCKNFEVEKGIAEKYYELSRHSEKYIYTTKNEYDLSLNEPAIISYGIENFKDNPITVRLLLNSTESGAIEYESEFFTINSLNKDFPSYIKTGAFVLNPVDESGKKMYLLAVTDKEANLYAQKSIFISASKDGESFKEGICTD